MVTYFTPRLCRVGSGVQPRACRHDAYVDLATAPPERVDSDEQLRHMAQAADSTHPLAGTPGLPDTVLAAVNFLRRVGLQNVKGLRESAIAYWSDRAVVLADEAAKVSASMPDNLRRIAGHLNIPLFKEMLHASHYPDEGLADDLIHGLCLHGSFGPLEGVFRTIPEGKRRPPTESLQELLRDGPRRARSLISRVEREESDFTTELWNSAMKEVDAGSMRGPYSFKEIEELFGDFVASRRFAVAQPSKVRPCDDFRRSGLNASMSFISKVSFPNPDAAVACARLLASTCGTDDLLFWKSDHTSAYRQVPCDPGSYKLTVIFLKDPSSGKAKAFFHVAQPFGTASSVYNYCRVSQALAHIGRILFGIPVLNYLDDYFSLEPSTCADSAFDTWTWLHSVLGWKLNLDKGVRPSSTIQILGVQLSISDGKILMQVPKEKLDSLLLDLTTVLQDGFLSSSFCSKLIGKLNYASGAIESSACKPYIRSLLHFMHHQFTPLRGSISAEAKSALEGFRLILSSSHYNRVIPLLRSDYSLMDNCVLYTDACRSGGIGAVLYQSSFSKPLYISDSVPSSFTDKLLDRHNSIIPFELYAVVAGLSSFEKYLRHKWITVFVDNESVERMLVRGYSPSNDLNLLVTKFWSICARLGLKQPPRTREYDFYSAFNLSPWQFAQLPLCLLKAGIFDWGEARSRMRDDLLASVRDPTARAVLRAAVQSPSTFPSAYLLHDSLINAVLQARLHFDLPEQLLHDTPPPGKVARRFSGFSSSTKNSVVRDLTAASEVLHILAVDPTTFSQYSSGFRSYLSFAHSVSSSEKQPAAGLLPASERVMLLWIVTFRNSESASNYVTHIRRWHSWLKLDMSWDTSSLSAHLKGLRKLVPSVSKPRKRISPALLSRIVEKSFSLKLPLMALVAILAYSFLLRVKSELLAVTIDDISLTREYVALRLKKRKTVPQGETILRYCTCSSNSLLCPVEAAKISVELHSTLRVQSPLLFGSVSYRSILVHLRSILSALHVKDSSEYGTHAFRRGHAHALASSGSSHEELCRAGSWRYKSAVPARIYADISEIEAIACRQALPDILESDSESDDD